MNLESLHIYPIKSAQGISVDKIKVVQTGFENDRVFAICNEKNTIITAREHPILFRLKTEIKENKLTISYNNKSKTIIVSKTLDLINLMLFKKTTFGKLVDAGINNWLSSILGFTCKLVMIDDYNLRKSENHNNITFSDEYPIHLIAQESITALSKKSNLTLTSKRFRPNVLVSDVNPFHEDKIDRIIIGECEFKAVSKTQRCSMITINPNTTIKDKNQEPLRTLAKEFRKNSKTDLGIYLIPTKTGVITKEDIINVIYK